MSMCESILTIALVCTVKYLHYCDYYYTLGNDSQSTPKLIAYLMYAPNVQIHNKNKLTEQILLHKYTKQSIGAAAKPKFYSSPCL